MWASDNERGGGEHAEAVTAPVDLSCRLLGDSGFTGSKGFPGSSVGKESACNAGDPGSIPGSGRSPGEGIGYPLQYSWASLMAQLVKNPPVMQETWIHSLGWEFPGEGKGCPLQYSGLETSTSMDCNPRGRKGSDMTE